VVSLCAPDETTYFSLARSLTVPHSQTRARAHAHTRTHAHAHAHVHTFTRTGHDDCILTARPRPEGKIVKIIFIFLRENKPLRSRRTRGAHDLLTLFVFSIGGEKKNENVYFLKRLTLRYSACSFVKMISPPPPYRRSRLSNHTKTNRRTDEAVVFFSVEISGRIRNGFSDVLTKSTKQQAHSRYPPPASVVCVRRMRRRQ